MKKFQVVTANGNKVVIEAEKARWNAESANYVEFLNASNERVAVFSHFQQWTEVADVKQEESEYSSTTKALFESASKAISQCGATSTPKAVLDALTDPAVHTWIAKYFPSITLPTKEVV